MNSIIKLRPYTRYLYPIYCRNFALNVKTRTALKEAKWRKQTTYELFDYYNNNDRKELMKIFEYDSAIEYIFHNVSYKSSKEWNNLLNHMNRFGFVHLTSEDNKNQSRRIINAVSQDVIIFNLCLLRNNFKLAESYFKFLNKDLSEMSSSALKTYLILYLKNNLFECNLNIDQNFVKNAAQLLEEIALCAPDEFSLSLVLAYTYLNETKKYEHIMSLVNFSQLPILYSYSSMVCFRTRNFEKAWEYFDLAHQLSNYSVVYNKLLTVWKNCIDAEKCSNTKTKLVSDFLNKMEKNKLFLPVDFMKDLVLILEDNLNVCVSRTYITQRYVYLFIYLLTI